MDHPSKQPDDVLRETADSLYCAAGGFNIDPWNPSRGR